MAELMEFLSEFEGDSGTLPLIHTTDAFTLKLIRNSGQLEPSDDEIYPGEKLLYMFYGRPSYRINSGIQFTPASFFSPICMIFDRDLLSQACRIMPFDTGAHGAGLMKETIHRKMVRKEFELEVDLKSPMKLIRCFYGDERRYLENNPAQNEPDIEKIQKEQRHYAEAYYHLVHHRSNSSQDERVNAIEIQFDKNIPIQGNLRAVILPSRHFDADSVEQIEKQFSATCIMYDMQATYKPTEIMNAIYERVRNFIISNRGE
jgi:hypothetical protein